MEQGKPESAAPDRGTQSITRQAFLKLSSILLGALIGVVMLVPMVVNLIATTCRRKKLFFSKVGEMDSLEIGKPYSLPFPFEKVDAYIHTQVHHEVWVIKHSDTIVTVYSPICPHLGCHYTRHPQKHAFICPCHGSVFTTTGKVVGGPAPRPLDTLPHDVKDGVLYVKWERFEAGVPQKIVVS